MFDPHTWHWPQWVEIAFIFLALITNAVEHGKPREGNHSFPVALMGAAILVFLLTMGGFFGARL